MTVNFWHWLWCRKGTKDQVDVFKHLCVERHNHPYVVNVASVKTKKNLVNKNRQAANSIPELKWWRQKRLRQRFNDNDDKTKNDIIKSIYIVCRKSIAGTHTGPQLIVAKALAATAIADTQNQFRYFRIVAHFFEYQFKFDSHTHKTG